MSKLKGLLLTEGMHGMISQVEGLAKALDLDFIHEKIVINNFWKIIPPKFTPVQDFVFKNKISNNIRITEEEALNLYKDVDLLTLGSLAQERRFNLVPNKHVSFVIDTNLNYTNIELKKNILEKTQKILERVRKLKKNGKKNTH